MKRKWIITMMILMPIVLNTVYAVDLDSVAQAAQHDIQSSMTGKSNSMMNGINVSDCTDPANVFGKFLQNGMSQTSGIVRCAVSAVSKTAVIMLLCGCASGFRAKTFPPQLIAMAGALGITSAVSGDINSIISLCGDTADQLSVLSKTMLPVVLTSVSLSGAPASGAVVTSGTLFALNLSISLISSVLMPAVSAYIAIITVNAALGNGMLTRAADFVRWASSGALKVLVTVFIGYITVVGSVSRGADSAAIRTARFALSASVPVVGGILSSAAETVLSGAGMLKNTVGVFGMICAAAVCIIPFVTIGINYLAFKAGTALLSPICPPQLIGLMDGLTNSLGLVLGMLGSCCVIVFFELVYTVAFLAGT